MTGLTGRRIVVTRPASQARSFLAALEALGAEPIALPTIEVVPVHPNPDFDRVLHDLPSFDWVIFTSVNGVEVFLHRASELGVDVRSTFRSVQTAAIGPATADRLQRAGITGSHVPARFVAEEILTVIGDPAGSRILLPRARQARKTIVALLRQRGATVLDIPTYDTQTPAADAAALEVVRAGVDAVTFTSPSTVRGFTELLGDDAPDRMRGVTVACIGPVTEQAAREAGFSVDLVASEFTTDGLAQAIADYFAGQPEQGTDSA